MKFELEQPEAVLKAQETKKGLNLFLELLVFVAVFLVSTIGQSLILAPCQIVLLSGNAEYIAAAASGDAEIIMEVTMELAGTAPYMICSLFSTIGMIVVVLLFCKLLQKRNPDTLGFTKKNLVKEYLIGMAVGFVIFSIAILICVVTGAVRLEGISASFAPGVILLFVIGFLFQGMAEEVLCRGYFMVSVGRRYPMIVAVLANSLFFAALHLANAGIGVLAFINLVLFGIFASLYFIRRGSIWGIGAVHSVWNFTQGNFYGVQVSGNAKTASVLETTMVEGKELINGGAFGLEGGLGVTIVLVVGILFLYFYQGKKQEKVQ